MSDASIVALRQMRRTRQRKRLGELEWFEAAYRVYMVALFGGGGVLWASSSIGDAAVSASSAADVLNHGPAILGMVAVLAFATGLRGGSQGGPLALEQADVTYVMLAPVDRRHALLKPAWQRLRSACTTGAATGAVLGQLAGRRLPGSPTAWAGGGALFGLNIGLLWVGAAMTAHALRLRRWIATVIAIGGIVWQGVAIVGRIAGPGDLDGSLGLWGWRQHPVDLAAIVFSLTLVVVGFVLLGRTSLDALMRRSSLVAQLRFAVTMQDLRTVVLLRRQLNQEQARRRPWLPTGRRGPAVWRRSWASLMRMPLTRLVRMSAMAAGVGLMQGLVVRGTSAAILGSMMLLFLLGLEVLEPLSQEVDHPDRIDALPVERGDLMMQILVAPAVLLIPFAAIAGTAAIITVGAGDSSIGRSTVIATTAILAWPMLLAGCCGAVVSVVRDAPDPFSTTSTQAFMPPEMAGMATVLRTLLPMVVSFLGASSVLIVRASYRLGQSTTAAAGRAAIGALLVTGLTAVWVRKRDGIRRSIKSFMSEGRSYTAQQRTSR